MGIEAEREAGLEGADRILDISIHCLPIAWDITKWEARFEKVCILRLRFFALRRNIIGVRTLAFISVILAIISLILAIISVTFILISMTLVVISVILVLISVTTIGFFFLLGCRNITEREARFKGVVDWLFSLGVLSTEREAVREAGEVRWVYGSPTGHLSASLGGLDVDTAMLTLQLHLVAIRADDLAHLVLAEAPGRARTF